MTRLLRLGFRLARTLALPARVRLRFGMGIRPPGGLKPHHEVTAGPAAEEQLIADRDTLREIVAGLERLVQLVDQTPMLNATERRGYFTPDEDDRVRQALLAYRNYRLAAYEIIFRYRDYGEIADENLRLRCFLVAFAAALTLYAASLKIIQLAEHRRMLRAKLNEPDAKYDLEAGFFDDVLVGYSSLSNYRALVRGDRFWRGQRNVLSRQGLQADPAWSWLPELIRRHRQIVHQRFQHVLRQRLRHDWRAFWKTAVRPARRTRYGLQTFLGGRFADLHVVPDPVHALTPGVLAALRPQLQPGDVLLCRAEGKLTAALLPGFWSHAALFLGSRAEIERLGVREQAHGARHWEEIPPNPGPLGVVIEAVSPRVRICPLETCLNADHVVVLRPNLPPGEIAAALGEALGHLGKPYDFEFDFNLTSRIVCTELIYRTYHHRGGCQFPLVKRLGRFTLTGDDIMHLALDELAGAGGSAGPPFQPVALLLRRRDGRAHAAPPDRIVSLLRRIRKGWRPARRTIAPLNRGQDR